MNIKLISLDQTKITLEIKIEIDKSYDKNLDKNNELSNIFIGQNLWNNGQIVGQITKINFENLSHNFEQSEPEKFDLKAKKVEIEKENKTESKFKIIKIECLGSFENCKWKGEWKFETDFVLSPKIWQKDENLEDLDEELEASLKSNLEIQKNPKNLENHNLTSKNGVEKQKNQKQKYYFIPTVQKFETVKAGQKLGFVETNGNLYWLICPCFENQYQIQIESGEFESSSKIGILIGKKNEYEITLCQSLNFSFGLIPQKSNEIVACGIPLFDLFCPFVQGNKTILHNFDESEIKNLLINIDGQSQTQTIIITDFPFFALELNTFQTKDWLELTKYFALCGNNVIVILENLPLNFEKYLDFFGNFETIGGEICSVSLFWIFENEENEENQRQNQIKTNKTINKFANSKYFENYWKLNQKIYKTDTNSSQKFTKNENQTNYSSSYPKNTDSNSKKIQIITLPDLTSSFGLSNFKKLLIDNIHKQNSPFINQNGNNKNSLNNLRLELVDFTNPFYELIMGQNTQNIEQSLTLWELFTWTKARFGEKFDEELINQNQSQSNFNSKNQLPNNLNNLQKIRENSAKLTELIQKTLQNEQNIGEIKNEITKILE